MSRRALIVGGSMAGLCAGLVSHPELLALLAEAGADTGTEFGVPIEDRRVVDRDGKRVARFRYPQIATSWTRLLHMLGDAFPREHYHLGKNVTAMSADAQHVGIEF